MASTEQTACVSQLLNSKRNQFNQQQLLQNQIPTKLMIFNDYHVVKKALHSIVICCRSNEHSNNVYDSIADCYNCNHECKNGIIQSRMNFD